MDDADARLRGELLVGALPAVRAFVHRLIREREAAEEILQEVSLRALAGEAPCDRDCFVAWTCGIARHVIGRYWRTRRRARAELPLESSDVEMMCDPVACPDERIDARESLRQVLGAVDDGGVALLIRRYVLDEPATSMANTLAQTPAALRMRLMRLRSSLRAHVGARQMNPSRKST